MANVKLLTLSGSCENLESFSHVFIAPKRIDCTPGCRDKILVPCDEVWNCLNPKKGQDYYTPMKTGDKFMMQTQFLDDFNADDENPISGFGTFMIASLCDLSGAVISTDHTKFFSQYLVAHDGIKSYQTFELSVDLINTNFPSLECFNLKLEAFNNSAELVDSLCSNHFQKYAATCNDLTLLVEAEGDKDCCESVYELPTNSVGTTAFKYSNKWRFYAELNRKNTEFSKTVFGIEKRTKIELDRVFQYRMTKAIPPYLFAYLTEVSLAGERLFINNEEHFIDEFSFSNDFESSCDFIGTIEVFQPCETDFKCS